MKKTILLISGLIWFYSLAFAGLEWKLKTTFQGETKAENNVIVSDAYAKSGNFKQVFESVEKENPMYKKGSYWLFKTKTDIMYWVNPEEKSYMEISLDSLFQMAGAAGKLVKIKISNPQVKVEKLGKETVLGFPCTHYRIVMDYETEVKVAIIKTRGTQHVEKEVWSSSQITGLKELGEMFRKRDFKTGMEDLDQLIEEQMKAEAEVGFPLKMVMTTVSTTKKGKETKSVMTQEVLSISQKALTDSFFEIPEDYSQTKGGIFGMMQ